MSLTKFDHGHVFNTKAEGGTVRHQTPGKGKKLMWGADYGRKGSVVGSRAHRGNHGAQERRNRFGVQP